MGGQSVARCHEMPDSRAQCQKNILEDFWRGAVASVAGDRAVCVALEKDRPFMPDQIISIGKAARSMCDGAMRALSFSGDALIISKRGLDESIQTPAGATVVEAGHPIPDEESLRAGELLIEAVRRQRPQQKLLLLVSGGASALAEVLHADTALTALRKMNSEWIASGLTIDEINSRRAAVSKIKGGKLLQRFSGAEVRTYAISDVRGDRVEVIGSGIGSTARVTAKACERVIASNADARQYVADRAVRRGFAVRLNEESLYGDVSQVAARMAGTLRRAEAGIYTWAGEPTIVLPESPGTGGRNQSLALELAIKLRGMNDFAALVASTDGDDGTSGVAGALIDGDTASDQAAAASALARADANTYLRRQDAIFSSGPTHTNVMDLAIAIVGAT